MQHSLHFDRTQNGSLKVKAIKVCHQTQFQKYEKLCKTGRQIIENLQIMTILTRVQLKFLLRVKTRPWHKIIAYIYIIVLISRTCNI